MTTPDPTLAARLAPCPFCGAIENLYVQHMDKTILHPAHRVVCDNCGASTGYTDSGRHIEAWNTRSGQLITAAEADARVEAAVLAEREAAKSMVWTLGHEIKASMLVDEDNERAVLDMVKATAAAIRSRGVTP